MKKTLAASFFFSMTLLAGVDVRYEGKTREFRNRFPLEAGQYFNKETPSSFAKLHPGFYADGKIELKEDGTIVISPKAYADDVVAFVAGGMSTNPTLDQSIVTHLHHFLNEMDLRSFARHGYSFSPEQADAGWSTLSLYYAAD